MISKKSREENNKYLKSVIGIDERNNIDWKNSIGCKIKYEYNWNKKCYEGELKIVKYEPKNQKVYFEGYKKGIKTNNLQGCELGGILGFMSSEFKYEIGNVINNLIIIDKEYRINKEGIKRKWYKYHCNKCENEDWIIECNLKCGRGCNACCSSPQKVVLGINTIWDKTKWMMPLGVSEKDAKTHTPSSNKKIEVKCPYCGRIKKISPNKIYKYHSIGCSCGDGVSYPEKLMESVLIQLGVEYEYQYKADWSKNKVYDFYLPDYNIIIETHGKQHYEEGGRGRSLKEEQENDELKKDLALKNRIEHYIIIDCSKSELEYIKNNILNSKLNEIFKNKVVDWNKCEEYALKNKVKEVCDYHKEHQGISTTDLVKEFSMSRKTIIKYLEQGTKLGWCKYDAKEVMRFNGKLQSKSVSQFTLDGEFIKTYPSASEAGREMGINDVSIRYCCNGKHKTAGGYIWKHAE